MPPPASPSLQARIRAEVDKAPPLTEAQIQLLSMLLAPARPFVAPRVTPRAA